MHPEANSARASLSVVDVAQSIQLGRLCCALSGLLDWTHEDRGTEESSGLLAHARGKDGGHCGGGHCFPLFSAHWREVAFGFVASPIPSFNSGLHRNSSWVPKVLFRYDKVLFSLPAIHLFPSSHEPLRELWVCLPV